MTYLSRIFILVLLLVVPLIGSSITTRQTSDHQYLYLYLYLYHHINPADETGQIYSGELLPSEIGTLLKSRHISEGVAALEMSQQLVYILPRGAPTTTGDTFLPSPSYQLEIRSQSYLHYLPCQLRASKTIALDTSPVVHILPWPMDKSCTRIIALDDNRHSVSGAAADRRAVTLITVTPVPPVSFDQQNEDKAGFLPGMTPGTDSPLAKLTGGGGGGNSPYPWFKPGGGGGAPKVGNDVWITGYIQGLRSGERMDEGDDQPTLRLSNGGYLVLEVEGQDEDSVIPYQQLLSLLSGSEAGLALLDELENSSLDDPDTQPLPLPHDLLVRLIEHRQRVYQQLYLDSQAASSPVPIHQLPTGGRSSKPKKGQRKKSKATTSSPTNNRIGMTPQLHLVGNDGTPPYKPNLLQCDECGLVVDNERLLSEHKRAKHGGLAANEIVWSDSDSMMTEEPLQSENLSGSEPESESESGSESEDPFAVPVELEPGGQVPKHTSVSTVTLDTIAIKADFIDAQIQGIKSELETKFVDLITKSIQQSSLQWCSIYRLILPLVNDTHHPEFSHFFLNNVTRSRSAGLILKELTARLSQWGRSPLSEIDSLIHVIKAFSSINAEGDEQLKTFQRELARIYNNAHLQNPSAFPRDIQLNKASYPLAMVKLIIQPFREYFISQYPHLIDKDIQHAYILSFACRGLGSVDLFPAQSKKEQSKICQKFMKDVIPSVSVLAPWSYVTFLGRVEEHELDTKINQDLFLAGLLTDISLDHTPVLKKNLPTIMNSYLQWVESMEEGSVQKKTGRQTLAFIQLYLLQRDFEPISQPDMQPPLLDAYSDAYYEPPSIEPVTYTAATPDKHKYRSDPASNTIQRQPRALEPWPDVDTLFSYFSEKFIFTHTFFDKKDLMPKGNTELYKKLARDIGLKAEAINEIAGYSGRRGMQRFWFFSRVKDHNEKEHGKNYGLTFAEMVRHLEAVGEVELARTVKEHVIYFTLHGKVNRALKKIINNVLEPKVVAAAMNEKQLFQRSGRYNFFDDVETSRSALDDFKRAMEEFLINVAVRKHMNYQEYMEFLSLFAKDDQGRNTELLEIIESLYPTKDDLETYLRSQ